MRTPTFVLLTSLIFSHLFIPQLAQQSPELKEASELSLSVMKLFKEGKFDEAIPLAKRALEIRERLLPPGDPMVLTALGNLGNLYNAKRDYNAAKKTFERLLALQEQQFGPALIRNSGCKIEIDETGKVLSAKDICQGPPFLTEASIQAARNARFSPTLLNGQPIKVTGVIQYNFIPR